jgi:hypothetical protein
MGHHVGNSGRPSHRPGMAGGHGVATLGGADLF